MHKSYRQRFLSIVFFLLIFTVFAGAQKTSEADAVLERNVRASMEFLASDAMQGRGSGSPFERVTAQYFAALMQQFGVEPAGQKDASGKPTYVQSVNIVRQSFAENPKLTFGSGAPLEHGKEMIVMRLNAAQASGDLQKIKLGETAKAGAVVFVQPSGAAPVAFEDLQYLANGSAAMIVVEENEQWRRNWERFAARRVSFTTVSDRLEKSPAIVVVSKNSAAALAQTADGAPVELKGALAEPQRIQTWNAVGKITGADAALASEVVLLSAHLDHLGVRENAPGADKIFNGADDDASGCVAVLELARVLAGGARPKRTVYFAFYGSEEAGGFGARYFVDNLEFPKEKLIANLQFEMIGRPDPKVKAEELWLTGYDRSNLGPELAKQGAQLVADPHPEENFFQRSDNYTLARQGIVAHTVSSFGLHKDYHQSSDELSTIDFVHMTRSINSMVKPVRWLINSNFKPAWNEGKKP